MTSVPLRSLTQKARSERGEERREKNIILKCEPWPKTREEEEKEEEEEEEKAKGKCGELTALEEKNSNVCEGHLLPATSVWDLFA